MLVFFSYCLLWVWGPDITPNEIMKTDAFETQCYRKLSDISWQHKVSNEEEIKRTGILKKNFALINKIKKLKLSYFGHIKRYQILERTMMDGKVERKRKRRLPNKQRKDEKEDWLGLSIVEAGRLASSRNNFRRVS